MTKTLLILGATGRMGRHAARAFGQAGWSVRRFDRARDRLPDAAKGADVIFNAWHVPYSRWEAELSGLTAQVIEAAWATGATVLIPGNVYVYGAGSPEVLGPETCHGATNPLGRLRRDMERAYREAGVRTILLRAGNFLDTEASGNWFDMIIAKSAHRGTLRYPGKTDIPHAWAYLPDLARAFVALAEKRGELPTFTEVTFEGYAFSGEALAEHCATALGRSVEVRRMSWVPLWAARLFWAEARHILEMRYLWNMPHRCLLYTSPSPRDS